MVLHFVNTKVVEEFVCAVGDSDTSKYPIKELLTSELKDNEYVRYQTHVGVPISAFYL